MEERPSLGELKKRVVRTNIGPFGGKKRQPPLVVVEIDAMRSQSAAKRDQGKLTSKQRMKWVSYLKYLFVTVAIRCN